MAVPDSSSVANEATAILRGVRFGTAWYPLVTLIMRVAAWVCFRRVTVRGERIPAHGAVVVIANHPAAWMDVVVLHIALHRRLHFMAQRQLFRPSVRGWFMRLYGSIPVVAHEDSPNAASWNATAFRACFELLDRDQVVGMFPEGVSYSDRSVRPFRPGLAWLALGYAAQPGRGNRLAVVPVGIHYGDRAGFRSDVEIVVGLPLRVTETGGAEGPSRASIQDFTQRAFSALTRLVVHVSDPETESLVRELEPIVLATPGDAESRGNVEAARKLAATIERLRDHDAAAYDTLWEHTKRYGRWRARLGVSDFVLKEPRAARSGLAMLARSLGLIAGVLPALIAIVVNVVPHMVTNLLARRFAPESSRIAFARLAFGGVLYLASYAMIGLSLWRGTRWSMVTLVTLLVITVLSSLVTLAYGRWLRLQWHRLKLAGREWREPEAVAEAQEARAALVRYVATVQSTSPGAAAGDRP